jgi:hypothetical protein
MWPSSVRYFNSALVAQLAGRNPALLPNVNAQYFCEYDTISDKRFQI